MDFLSSSTSRWAAPATTTPRSPAMSSTTTDSSPSKPPLNLPKLKRVKLDQAATKRAPQNTRLLQQQQEQLAAYQRQVQKQEQQLQSQQEQLDRLSELLMDSDRPPALPRRKPRQTWQWLSQKIARLRGSDTYQPRFSLQQIMLSYLGSFLGIAALAYISVSTSYPLIAAPFGAAAVLVFAMPSSPLAQPRNLICGNFIGALAGLVMVNLFGAEPWVMALAVATAIKLMQLTRTLHPPGGAVALVGVMSHAQWEFLFTPVLTGSIVLLLCTILYNNLMPGRSYPQHWL